MDEQMLKELKGADVSRIERKTRAANSGRSLNKADAAISVKKSVRAAASASQWFRQVYPKRAL